VQRIDLIGARPRTATGVAAAVAAVALTTTLIYPLLEVAPPVSTGVTYLVAVLLISVIWGFRLGLLTAVLSALCFNWFHIPPTGRFTIADGENWVALAVFFVAAAIASSVAELARARAADAELRRREASLSAEMARLLLAGGALDRALPEVSAQLAGAMGLDWARVEIGAVAPPEGALAIPLESRGGRVATLLVPEAIDDRRREQIEERIEPALATLVAAALERERLEAGAVEAIALRRSDELKTALLRSVSHDLRTPLTAVVAAAGALDSAMISAAERDELAEVVQVESARLARLVDQLLDLSRLEAGAAEPRREWSSVDEIVRAAVEQVGHSRFELDFDPGLPLVNADAAQLERALVNVLENAVGHSGDDPVTVHARRVGSLLVVSVVDRGGGVPAGDLERIFEPFYRGESARSSGRTGSGLGLAIARGFVAANGGRIRAESLPGQGTTVVIELPVEPQPVAPAREATRTRSAR
jgi:two-component system sensor histidine kinase KdpD